MKRTLSLLVIFCVSVGIFAQRTDLTPRIDIEGVTKTTYQSIPKGTPVLVMSVINLKTSQYDGIYLSVSVNNMQIPIPANQASKILELHPKTMEQFWMSEYIKANMFGYYDSKGYHKSLRQDLIDESEDYLDGISDLIYGDAYTEDYIHTIFTRIVPREFNSKRTERATVKIIQSPDPYANMLANGTLLISTGLLSTIDSEEELTAIIASNIAHYVLDHPVINVKKQIYRARRAEFWGGFLVAVAGGVEMVLTETNDNYFPGGIMLTAAVAGEALNYSAAQRLGMGYSDKQIKQADCMAVEFLKFNNIEPAALASVLYKIGEYHVCNPRSTTQENFNNLRQRLKDLKQPRIEFSNRVYQRKVSGLNTLNAIIQLNSGNYESAQKLANKNIQNNLATDEDYVVLVKTVAQNAVTREDNERCLEIIKKGKAISDIPNLELYKQEILILMRLDKQMKANDTLNEYISLLSDFKESTTNTDDSEWASNELNWANKLHKQITKF